MNENTKLWTRAKTFNLTKKESSFELSRLFSFYVATEKGYTSEIQEISGGHRVLVSDTTEYFDFVMPKKRGRAAHAV